MSFQVFLCHAHKDNTVAREIAQELTKNGLSVWLDNPPEAGAGWNPSIADQLEGCSAVVVLLSAAAHQSRWMANELEYAQGLGKEIFPIRIEQYASQAGVVDFNLQGRPEAIEAFDRPSRELACREIVAVLHPPTDAHDPRQQADGSPAIRDLLTRAIDVFGNKDAAQEWVREEIPSLEGRRPIDLITGSQKDRERVYTILGRIEAGVF